jgi:hypothetical protein
MTVAINQQLFEISKRKRKLLRVQLAIATLSLVCSSACSSSATRPADDQSHAGAPATAGAAGTSASTGGTSGTTPAGSSDTAGTSSAGANNAGASGTLAAAGAGSGGVGGAPGTAGGGGGAAAGAAGTLGSGDPSKRRLLLRDEARSSVSYVDLGNPAADWHVVTAYGRDLQLVGGGRFMIGTENGYEERSLTNGALLGQQTAFPGTLTAHRLRNGNTILAGVNWQGGTGIVLIEVNAAGALQSKISFPDFSYVRLIRQTPSGTFLVTADTVVFEGDATGKILWRVDAAPAGSHVWQALRIPSGETVVTTGYAASIEIFGADKTLHTTITGPTNVTPYFFGGFQILSNGDFVVANWQGHMGEKQGVQLLEFNPQGALVWSYEPNTTTESLSLHHVIVLDGLDTSKLQVDDTTGVLVPVP